MLSFDPYKLVFEKLGIEGVKQILLWADEEGWNPGPHDAEIYYETDPDGFYGYYHNNELIAGGFIISYNGEYGFMGGFIVRPEHRANGIGRKLWYQRRDTLLSRLKKGASIGMDGVIAMQQFYKKGGFEIAFRDERHEKIGMKCDVNKNILPIADQDFTAIVEYDKQCFGFRRPQFLRPWINLPGSKSFMFIDNGKLKGYAFVRKVNKGYKVCPLFADDAEIAEELYKACLNAVEGEALYIDIPMINEEAVKLINKYDTRYVFECARMYYGDPPLADINKVFGLTTFEIG